MRAGFSRDRGRFRFGADPSVTGSVARFALAGVVALAVVGVVSFFVTRNIGTSEAMDNANEVTRIVGRGIVEPALTPAVLHGRPAALARFDRTVQRYVLVDPIVRVKLWSPSGRIVYSDESRLIGERYALGGDEVRSIRTGELDSDVSDLTRPENRFERDQGKLLEVYLPIEAPNGGPLLFEAYQQFSSVAASGRSIWLAFAPALIGALLVLWLVQVPLAASMAGRLRRRNEEREALLQRTVDASDAERRRIAGDLHDGVVQELAGLSYSLAAAAERADQAHPDAAQALRRGAEGTRESVRSLRSLLIDIYPPSLRDAGLESAFSDLVAPLEGRGIDSHVDVPDAIDLPPEREALLYRVAQEAVRNAATHAEPNRVDLRLFEDAEGITLTVEDDGVGFSPNGELGEAAPGHMGLKLLRDLAADAGSTLEVDSAPGEGTRVRLRLGRS